MNNKPTKRLYGYIDTIKKPEQKAIVPLNMAEGNQIIRPKIGCVLSEVVVEKPDTLSPENILKGVNIGGVVGSYAGPPLFPATITGGLNTLSWSNNTQNGGFPVEVSAKMGGNIVSSPYAIQEEDDGKILTVTSSSHGFDDSSVSIEVVYVDGTQNVIASLPPIPDDGGEYHIRFFQANTEVGYTMGGEYLQRYDNGRWYADFDPTKPYNFVVTRGGTLKLGGPVTVVSNYTTYYPAGCVVEYFVNGENMGIMRFDGTSIRMNTDTHETALQNYTNSASCMYLGARDGSRGLNHIAFSNGVFRFPV